MLKPLELDPTTRRCLEQREQQRVDITRALKVPAWVFEIDDWQLDEIARRRAARRQGEK